MIRDTSLMAYEAIIETGLISERRSQVLRVLAEYGPATANELLPHLRQIYGVQYSNSPQITSRLGELRNLGVAKELKKRKCSVTGMTVIEWKFNPELPRKKKKPRRELCEHCNGKGYVEFID